jgi:hypothetical protein
MGAVCGGVAVAMQTHMLAAKNDLSSALNNLNQASPDKAGHRESAINLVKQALTEVNAGIQAGAK